MPLSGVCYGLCWQLFAYLVCYCAFTMYLNCPLLEIICLSYAFSCIVYVPELAFIGVYSPISCVCYGPKSAFVRYFPIPCVFSYGPKLEFLNIFSSDKFTISKLTCVYQAFLIESNKPFPDVCYSFESEFE